MSVEDLSTGLDALIIFAFICCFKSVISVLCVNMVRCENIRVILECITGMVVVRSCLYFWSLLVVPWALWPLPCWLLVSWKRFWNFLVFALPRLSLGPGNWNEAVVFPKRQHCCNFIVKGQVQNTTNSTGWTRMTCEGAKRTVRKLAFHTKHEKMSVVGFRVFNLVNIFAEIPWIYHSRTFCYLLLKDISTRLIKVLCLL